MSLTGNPYIDTAIVAYGLFLMGRLSVRSRTEEIIENTIDHLIREGYINTEYDENGDVVLLKASKD
jgi:hypothetical protein